MEEETGDKEGVGSKEEGGATREDGEGTVSYTHLRAHET